MMNLYNVPTPKCFDLVTCYVSHWVSEVIEGLTEYHSKHWPDLSLKWRSYTTMPRLRKGTPSVTSTPSSLTRHTSSYTTYQISGSINMDSYGLEDGSFNTGRSQMNNFRIFLDGTPQTHSKLPWSTHVPSTSKSSIDDTFPHWVYHWHCWVCIQSDSLWPRDGWGFWWWLGTFWYWQWLWLEGRRGVSDSKEREEEKEVDRTQGQGPITFNSHSPFSMSCTLSSGQEWWNHWPHWQIGQNEYQWPQLQDLVLPNHVSSTIHVSLS